MAMPPRSTAAWSLREPSSRPMGVRAPATITEFDGMQDLHKGSAATPATIPRRPGLSSGRVSGSGGKDVLTRIDHIGIACHDLDATIEFYRRTYGFADVHVEVNEEQGVREAMLKINDAGDGGATYLQLLEPVR